MYNKIINISDRRCTGKTNRLLLLAKENNAIFVCANPNVMKEKALAYGIVGIDFMSYVQYINQGKGLDRKFVIDEMDGFLNVLSSGNLVAYTNSIGD